jgi:hypothetical protein
VRRRIRTGLLLSAGVLLLGSTVSVGVGSTLRAHERGDAAAEADRRMSLAQAAVSA